MDTLEVLPYDWLKKRGVSFADINVRYMGNTPEAVEAFKAGALDMICNDRALWHGIAQRRQGQRDAVRTAPTFTARLYDCVLAVRSELIKTNAAGIKLLIKGMMKRS